MAGQTSTYVLKAPAPLAQKLAFASDSGTLWFLLRPAVGAKRTPPLTVTMQTLLAQAKPEPDGQVDAAWPGATIRALVAVEGLDTFDVQRALPDDPSVPARSG